MALISSLLEILQKPSVGDVVLQLMLFTTPIWVAVIVGVLVGWAWKPRFTAFSSTPNLNLQFPRFISWISDETPSSSPLRPPTTSASSLQEKRNSGVVVDENDLHHLHSLVEEKDGGPSWIPMMDRTSTNMTYQAWRRDPETGPPQYRSRTVYERAIPEMVRDFFWDDEFRMKWDDMLIHSQTLEACPATGTMVVQWVRKFPFFCSDREYIIGRRIWKCGQTYYCVTKGVPNSSVPRKSKPRRVDLYYSSWCIRPAEWNGETNACEVILFHHEDMGIPWEIAKLGVRQGMWGAVKKIDSGLRAYQRCREEASGRGPPLMAEVNTKVTSDDLERGRGRMSEEEAPPSEDHKQSGRNVAKLLVVGGAVAVACSIDRGLLTKALIFGVARKLAGFGKRI